MSEEKLKLPMTNDQCPACGSKTHLIKKAIDELKEDGTLNKDAFPEGCYIPFPLLDQRHPPKILLADKVKLPILNIYIEVCPCGEIYCTKFDLAIQEVPLEMMKMGKPPGGKMPFMGKG